MGWRFFTYWQIKHSVQILTNPLHLLVVGNHPGYVQKPPRKIEGIDTNKWRPSFQKGDSFSFRPQNVWGSAVRVTRGVRSGHRQSDFEGFLICQLFEDVWGTTKSTKVRTNPGIPKKKKKRIESIGVSHQMWVILQTSKQECVCVCGHSIYKLS